MRAASWNERNQRLGWDTQYTLIGGKWRTKAPLDSLEAPVARDLRQFSSQAFIACTKSDEIDDFEIKYWASVCRKIIQRGKNPPISILTESLIGGPAKLPMTAEGLTSGDLLDALVDKTGTWDVDSSFELHEQWELPFWKRVSENYPTLARWLTPQAPLEVLAGSVDASSRWVDFFLWKPGTSPRVIEIDGSGHARQQGVDAQRDKLLRDANVSVNREDGAFAVTKCFVDSLASSELDPPIGMNEVDRGEIRRLILGPSTIQRLGYAFVEAVVRGFLPKGQTWKIGIDDSIGVAECGAGGILDQLSAIDQLWNLGVVPDQVFIGSTLWRRTDSRFHSSPCKGEVESFDVKFILDTNLPPHAKLPESEHNTVVIRNAYLRGVMEWPPFISMERKNVHISSTSEAPLTVLLNELFGLTGFRAGQLAPVQRILSGLDGAVMLPTGAGKSLIYQLAGLLRPGITIIVDPIVSLIDDQFKRLKEEGIDRVAALHAFALSDAALRDETFEAISSGDTLFAFLTPERLQTERFREHLGGAAAKQLVNLAVIDEAHCVSEWGHDFRTSYLRLGRNLRELCKGDDDIPPPILALTGTASPAVLRDLLRETEIDPNVPGALQRPESFDRANLHYASLATNAENLKDGIRNVLVGDFPGFFEGEVNHLFSAKSPALLSGLIFVPHTNGERGVVAIKGKVTEILKDEMSPGIIDVYSGGPPRGYDPRTWNEVRRGIVDRFMKNEVSVLVTTKAFGMGIDKSDVRFTIHVGLPSSIESFAQESGRAGRNDSKAARCWLLAAMPTRDEARVLFDLNVTPEQRRSAFEAHRQRRTTDDVGLQLYFLYNSFPSVEREYAAAASLFDEIWEKGKQGMKVEVPFDVDAVSGISVGDSSKPDREKALYRLSALGIVDDYTVDFGAKSFCVYLGYFDNDSIDESLRAYSRRIEPGRMETLERIIRIAPVDFDSRLKHHLMVKIEMLYRVIEPARLRALEEMYRLALDQTDEMDMRKRINAYLGDGPLSSILPSLIYGTDKIAVLEAIRALETVPVIDPAEWAGSTARQLEETPEHPIALIAGALAEAWLVEGDPQRFQDLLGLGLSNFSKYDVPNADRATFFIWVQVQLESQFAGRRLEWRALAWLVVPDEFASADEMLLEEHRAISNSVFTDSEKKVVLSRKLLRASGETINFINREIGTK